jgi:hypothetical protein
MIVYGGRGISDVWTSDTWTWDGASWTAVQQSQHPVLRFAMGAFDARISKVVIYGLTSDYSSTETWTWDGTWQQVTGAVSPPARAASAMAYDSKSGSVILFGGRSPDLSYLGDTWAFDGVSWTRLSPKTSPSARQNHLMATVWQGVLLYGGGVGTTLPETWLWNGTDWQRLLTLHSPAQWSPAGIASRNGEAVLVSYASKDAEAQTYVMSHNDWLAN